MLAHQPAHATDVRQYLDRCREAGFPQPLVIVGEHDVGKTALAMSLARRFTIAGIAPRLVSLSLDSWMRFVMRRRTFDGASGFLIVCVTVPDCARAKLATEARPIGWSALFVPPLRLRPCDILAATKLWCSRYAEVDKKALARLQAHSWPGNLSELKDRLFLLQVAALRARCAKISETDVEHVLAKDQADCAREVGRLRIAAFAADEEFAEACSRVGLRDTARLIESVLIRSMLAANRHNLARAARLLQTPHSTLKSRVEALAGELAWVSKWLF